MNPETNEVIISIFVLYKTVGKLNQFHSLECKELFYYKS